MDLYIAVDRKEDEMMITKHTTSIFIGKDFEETVRNAGYKNYNITGISTELGVKSSARDALNRDFYPVIVSDVHCYLSYCSTSSRQSARTAFSTLYLYRIITMFTSTQVL